MRGPRRDDLAVDQQQAGALFVLLRIENHGSVRAARAGSGKGRLNGLRPAEHLGAERGVERVQPLKVGARRILRHGDDVDHAIRPARPVDDRRRGDPDLRCDLRATASVARGLAGAEERGAPEHGAGDGVHRVDTVVLRRNVQHVVRAVPGNRDRGQVERLRIHFAVHREHPILPNVVTLTVAGVRIDSFRF